MSPGFPAMAGQPAYPRLFGGFIGSNSRENNYENYFSADYGRATRVVGALFTAGVTGLTTAQMKQQAMFTGFDFSSIWQINEGVTEPFLNGAVAVTATTTSLASSGNTRRDWTKHNLHRHCHRPTCLPAPCCSRKVAIRFPAASPSPFRRVRRNAPSPVFALGTHGISAHYSGDSLNTGSLSPTLNQMVVPVSLNVEASNPGSKYDALTDGVLIVRYLEGRDRQRIGSRRSRADCDSHRPA
jgi:hypothetical protein